MEDSRSRFGLNAGSGLEMERDISLRYPFKKEGKLDGRREEVGKLDGEEGEGEDR